ncbi:MAG: hypothetical protein IPI49_25260 [Myxococcales bacterium]|nr:hypothetical protein [Myxococcales bacterium]HRC58663.1 hypothetical protein [Kofleriaceae bacterium]
MLRITSLCLIACALLGCERKHQAAGLPPAQNWSEGAAGSAAAMTGPAGASAAANPHAGVDMNDPHAGVDMTGGGGGGVDVTKMGLQGPDPNRPVDPSKFVRGSIKTAPGLKDKVKPGTAVFVVAKKADPSGQPVAGAPLAVTRLEWPSVGQELAFQLTEADQMIAGTQFAGDIVVSVRYDQDSDALSKQAGDLTGLQKVTIPAEGVTVMLDTILP